MPSRNLINVLGEHTFDKDILAKSMTWLDIGCRNFSVSNAAREILPEGAKMICMEPDKSVHPVMNDYVFVNKALIGKSKAGTYPYFAWGNGTGNFVNWNAQYNSGHVDDIYQVECIDIESLMVELGVDYINTIKMDCEGGEYSILAEWPGPIADQISVEFHEHVGGANPAGDAGVAKIIEHMSQWYDLVQHVKEPRHGLCANWWDSLFVLKGS